MGDRSGGPPCIFVVAETLAPKAVSAWVGSLENRDLGAIAHDLRTKTSVVRERQPVADRA